jgi:hypothetical protein
MIYFAQRVILVLSSGCSEDILPFTFDEFLIRIELCFDPAAEDVFRLLWPLDSSGAFVPTAPFLAAQSSQLRFVRS